MINPFRRGGIVSCPEIKKLKEYDCRYSCQSLLRSEEKGE